MASLSEALKATEHHHPSSIEELRAIARDEQKYESYTNWRYQHPREWSEGFRKLLRVMSTDIKAGVCSVLQKGDVVYPKAAPIKGTCDHDRILGRNPLAWTIDDIDRRRPRDPTDFLEVIPCSEKHDPTDECFKWRETPIGEKAIVSPEEKRRRGAERRAEAATFPRSVTLSPRASPVKRKALGGATAGRRRRRRTPVPPR